MKAVLRRSTAPGRRASSDVCYRQRLIADFDAVAVAVDRCAVRLTRAQSSSCAIAQNKNRVVSRDRLLERVWGYDRLVETRSVDVHVGRLRQKLGPPGHQRIGGRTWLPLIDQGGKDAPAAVEQFRPAPHARTLRSTRCQSSWFLCRRTA